MARGYEADLAYVHDVGFSDYVESAAPWLIESLASLPSRGLVVDLGCGGGRFLRRLLDAGYTALGIDQSAAMIALAKENAPGACLQVGSFASCTVPRCVAVTALGEVFNYLFDESNDADVLEACFSRIYAALEPGGALVFDVAGPGRTPAEGSRSFREGPGWAVLYSAEESPGHQHLVRRITTFRAAAGDVYRRTEEVHRLRLYAAGDIMARLGRVGFSVRQLKSYGNCQFFPGHAGFWATK